MKGDELEDQILKELDRDKLRYEIELEKDIYCVGFLVFLTTDSPKLISNVVLKCIFCLII